MNPTPDEDKKIALLITDIEIYIDEMYVKFIIGKEPLENYGKYIRALKDMGIDKVSDLLPPPKEAGASWDVPTTVGIITKLSPLAQRFMIFLR